MVSGKNKKFKFYSFLILFLIISLYLFFYNFQEEKKISLEPISINLLTSIHPSLPWKFVPLKSNININKKMLLDCVNDKIPKELYRRKKTGFAI